MAGVVDTNVLLYAANRDAEEHPAARNFLLSVDESSNQWYVTDGILYEFLRVATHPRVFPRPLTWQEALSFVEPLVTSERFRVLTVGADHWELLAQMLAVLTHPAGNLFFDIRTATLMREYGIREIYTADTDFLQFRDLTVINPLTAS